MVGVYRMSTTTLVIGCLLLSPFHGTLFASDSGISPAETAVPAAATTVAQTATRVDPAADVPVATDVLSISTTWQKDLARLRFDSGLTLGQDATLSHQTQRFEFSPGFTSFAQVYQGPPYPYPYHAHHDGALAAIMFGAAAAITGTAVLVYANRPECTTNPIAGGCGYGTKVVGSAVLSGGLVGLFVGALTW